jgi:molecular chaperone Hsp33
MLRGLGEQEVREVLQEQGAVTVTCDFCNHPYEYDAAAVAALFAAETAGSNSEPGRESGRALH